VGGGEGQAPAQPVRDRNPSIYQGEPMNKFQRKPRTFQAGDPEPADVASVRDCEGDQWVLIEPKTWLVLGDTPDCAVSWQGVLQYAPLTEVTR
jgi:hypothetical protein